MARLSVSEHDRLAWSDNGIAQPDVTFEDSCIRSSKIWRFWSDGTHLNYAVLALDTLAVDSTGVLTGASCDGPISCFVTGTTICVAYFSGLDLMYLEYTTSFSTPEKIATIEAGTDQMGTTKACAVAAQNEVFFLDKVYAHPNTSELPTLVVRRATKPSAWSITTCPYAWRWEPNPSGANSTGMGVEIIDGVRHVYFAAIDSDWGSTNAIRYDSVFCVRFLPSMEVWKPPVVVWQTDFLDTQSHYISDVKTTKFGDVVWVFFKWEVPLTDLGAETEVILATCRTKDGFYYTMPEIEYIDRIGKILTCEYTAYLIGPKLLAKCPATSKIGITNPAVILGPFSLISASGSFGSSKPGTFNVAINPTGSIYPRDLVTLTLKVNAESATFVGRIVGMQDTLAAGQRLVTLEMADQLAESEMFSHAWMEKPGQNAKAVDPNQLASAELMPMVGSFASWLDPKDKELATTTPPSTTHTYARLLQHTILAQKNSWARSGLAENFADGMIFGALTMPSPFMRHGAIEMQFYVWQDWNAVGPWYDRLGAHAMAGMFWGAPGEALAGDPNQIMTAVHSHYCLMWDWKNSLAMTGSENDQLKFWRRYFTTPQPQFDAIARSSAMGWAPPDADPTDWDQDDYSAHWHGLRVVNYHGQVKVFKAAQADPEGLKVTWTLMNKSDSTPFSIDHLCAYGLGYWGLFCMGDQEASNPGSSQNPTPSQPVYFRGVRAYDGEYLLLEDAIKFIATKFGVLDFDFQDLFFDDFSTSANWTLSGSTAITGGKFACTGTGTGTCSTGFPSDYGMTAKVRVVTGSANFRIRGDANNYYQVKVFSDKVVISRVSAGATDMYQIFPTPFALNSALEYTVRVLVRERWISVWIEEILIGAMYDDSLERNIDRDPAAPALADPILAAGVCQISGNAPCEFYVDDLRVPELFEPVEFSSFGPEQSISTALGSLLQNRVISYFLKAGTFHAASFFYEREDGGVISNAIQINTKKEEFPNWIRVQGNLAIGEYVAPSAQGPVRFESVILNSAACTETLRQIAQRIYTRRTQESEVRTYGAAFDPTLDPEMLIEMYHPNGNTDWIVTNVDWRAAPNAVDMTLIVRRGT